LVAVDEPRRGTVTQVFRGVPWASSADETFLLLETGQSISVTNRVAVFDPQESRREMYDLPIAPGQYSLTIYDLNWYGYATSCRGAHLEVQARGKRDHASTKDK
jgi:hypothetical protein